MNGSIGGGGRWYGGWYLGYSNKSLGKLLEVFAPNSFIRSALPIKAVSYTHLTLPTKA